MSAAVGFTRLRAVSATDNSFPSRVPTATAPTGTGVVDLSPSAGQVWDNLLLAPFGDGADNSTFTLRVIGWRFVTDLWVPVPLAEVACTLSAAVGVSGKTLTNTDRLADTLTLASGYNQGVGVDVVSPTGDVAGHLVLDLRGFAKAEVIFQLGTATGANALVSNF